MKIKKHYEMGCTWREKIKKEIKKIFEAHWSSNYDITRTVKKILIRQVQRHHKISPTMTWVCHTCCPKVTGGSLSFGGKCDPLGSPSMTFLGVIRFVTSKSFQLYQKYHNRSFDVSLGSFFFLSFFFFFFFFSSHCNLWWEMREKRKEKQ